MKAEVRIKGGNYEKGNTDSSSVPSEEEKPGERVCEIREEKPSLILFFVWSVWDDICNKGYRESCDVGRCKGGKHLIVT